MGNDESLLAIHGMTQRRADLAQQLANETAKRDAADKIVSELTAQIAQIDEAVRHLEKLS